MPATALAAEITSKAVVWSREEVQPGVFKVAWSPKGSMIYVPDFQRYKRVMTSGVYSPGYVKPRNPPLAATTDWSIGEIRKAAIRRGHRPGFRCFADSSTAEPRPFWEVIGWLSGALESRLCRGAPGG